MRDIIVRLASMKLAELKFEVVVSYADKKGYIDNDSDITYSVSLKDMPKIINKALDEFPFSSVKKYVYGRRNIGTLFILETSWRDGGEHVYLTIEKPKSISDQLFFTLLKSIGLSTGTATLTSTYKLAGMKLAELKFDYAIENQLRGRGHYENKNGSLSELKKVLFNLLNRHSVDLVTKQMKIQTDSFDSRIMWCEIILRENRFPYLQEGDRPIIKVAVAKPNSMDNKTFLTLMTSLLNTTLNHYNIIN